MLQIEIQFQMNNFQDVHKLCRNLISQFEGIAKLNETIEILSDLLLYDYMTSRQLQLDYNPY